MAVTDVFDVMWSLFFRWRWLTCLTSCGLCFCQMAVGDVLDVMHVFSVCQMAVADVFDVMWSLGQPMLFGLIGAEVDLENIELSRVGM